MGTFVNSLSEFSMDVFSNIKLENDYCFIDDDELKRLYRPPKKVQDKVQVELKKIAEIIQIKDEYVKN